MPLDVGILAMTTKHRLLTPLSQRVSVERYAAKQLERGMIKVSLWIPEHRADEFKELADLARIEFELNGVPQHETK